MSIEYYRRKYSRKRKRRRGKKGHRNGRGNKRRRIRKIKFNDCERVIKVHSYNILEETHDFELDFCVECRNRLDSLMDITAEMKSFGIDPYGYGSHFQDDIDPYLDFDLDFDLDYDDNKEDDDDNNNKKRVLNDYYFEKSTSDFFDLMYIREFLKMNGIENGEELERFFVNLIVIILRKRLKIALQRMNGSSTVLTLNDYIDSKK